MADVVVFHDKYHSGQWLVICGECSHDGMVMPFGTDEIEARGWRESHKAGHVSQPWERTLSEDEVHD
jgi:hypothetical protein